MNALEGKGVHVVTVNDYLAKRDSEWMGQIYNFLGMSVGCILSDKNDDERRIAYKADITYGTNNEFGFDYLRDNMKYELNDMVQRTHNYCIVDEVDSILIDESRTPLVISGKLDDKTTLYLTSNEFIKYLQKIDFELDEDKCRCLADEQRKRRKSIFSVKRKNSCHHLIFVLFLIQQTSNNINIQTYLSQKFAEGTNFISLWKGLTRSYKSEQAYWKKKEGNKKLGRKKRQ